MKKIWSLAAVALVLLAGIVANVSAYDGHRRHGGHYRGHHGGHHRGHHGGGGSFGFYFGAPLWGSSFYGPSYYRPYRRPYFDDYYYREPRTVIIERDPPVYIQQPVQQAQQSALWYYCPNPAGYYPHVASCSQQWVPVDPNSVPPATTR